MTIHPEALTGLMPAIGAGALIWTSTRRAARRRRTDPDGTPPAGNLARMIQMPKELPPGPGRPAPRRTAAVRPCPGTGQNAGGTACGNDLEPGEALCGLCRRDAAQRATPKTAAGSNTLLHWLLLLAMLAAIGGLGLLL
ncbi:hypothetical protein [Frigidibacter oleivorans]|uniref:hypothetical protein n=1 Tax=Frigidibacter oleivorans TaxID=2487129 RepID=UPI000F8C7F43|nr:hypothetical protein [Frigidibacter oleivorans]